MEDQAMTSSLQDRINELEAKQAELLASIESKETEFGKKRAQFKELFLQKETQLNNEVANLKVANEQNARLLTDLKNVSAERDNLRTAVLITETSSSDEFQAMKSKYQEEITSLKAIMEDAVRETRQETSAMYEKEQRKLLIANQELEAKVVKYKTQLRELKSKQHPEDDGSDGLFDVLPGAWKKPSATEDNGAEKDENLEDSMKKAQEDAEALRAIVMPLEEEIAALKSKLRNANEKVAVLEAKEKKQVKSQSDSTAEKSQISSSSASIEELEEKVKELAQYLEAERSARTDLEMFVAVLNTQKGVLQEDADKLRRELHNVCRLLEQEKEEHVALKDTWEMANDRFLETQQMQRVELDKIKTILTVEQRKLLDEELKNSKESLELLTPPPPVSKNRFLNRKAQKQAVNKKEIIKTRKITATEAKRTLQSLVRGPKPNAQSPSQTQSILDADVPTLDSNASPLLPSVSAIPQITTENKSTNIAPGEISTPVVDDNLKAFSDGESNAGSGEKSMKKYKSADDLETSEISVPAISSRSKSEEFGHANLERNSTFEKLADREKPGKDKIDWKSFEEAAKSSLSNETDRSCAMCRNYEKQLQNLQGKNEELFEEMSVLLKRIKEEQETIVVLKRANERLEQSIKLASEDAQAQINAAGETQRNLENLLEEINADIDKTKQEAAEKVNELMVSRDSLMARCEQLAENYTNLQSKSVYQNLQVHSADGGELERIQEKFQALQAVSKTKEEKLQSEINFMKAKITAEQVAKGNIEELYQVELGNLESEVKKLRKELDMEHQRNKQLGQPQLLFEGEASNEVIAVLEKQLQEASKEKVELKQQLKELKSQIHSLNGQLNSSESVQRDFVRLSQSLQMELVEMKESQKGISWEHEDDVGHCQKCEANLDLPQDKHHCRNCGKIFCDTCSSKTMNSPGSSKPVRVCVDCSVDIGSDVKGAVLTEDRETNKNTNVDEKETAW